MPRPIRDELLVMLEHYGQAPIIVRSSSLLEDGFGNAFAGKYDSIFLTNQGSPDDRLTALEDAIRQVYASAVGEAALEYRRVRGLADVDEQMALLVQRVSGDHHDGLFLPDAAGVATSASPYVWRPDLPDAGTTRLVLGLGTRAVDRTGSDVARIVALADPTASPVDRADVGRYSQHRVDVLDLAGGAQTTLPIAKVRQRAPEMPWPLAMSVDEEGRRRLQELGRRGRAPEVVDFAGLLGQTPFPYVLRRLLATLQRAYGQPVDVEYTVNVDRDGVPRVNVVQCRPLRSRARGAEVGVPDAGGDHVVLSSATFMGRNVRLALEYVVLVRPDRYLLLGEADRYAVARLVGQVNRALHGRAAMLIGPGRWGTSTPSLGVPAHFTELNGFSVLVETTSAEQDFRPDLSYGSHFFTELVELGITYVALRDDQPGASFHPGLVTDLPNHLVELVPGADDSVVHVARTPGWALYSDVAVQRLVVTGESQGEAG